MLEAIGYDREVARWAVAADCRAGRVVSVEEGIASLLTERGAVDASFGGSLLGKIAADPAQAPCAGDWGVVRDWPDKRVTLERLVPRRTTLVREIRGMPAGEVVCANVDIVAMVVALEPRPVTARVEQLLEMARSSGAMPLLVLTKSDLVTDPGRRAAGICGCDHVVWTSTVTGEGIDRVREMVQGHLTMALIGAGGHGKSALLRALAGADELAARRAGLQRRRLTVLPGGGAVIDTPPVRVA
jgi:ribosome biogenesis GTPase / thiamine phosphate phosphatase